MQILYHTEWDKSTECTPAPKIEDNLGQRHPHTKTSPSVLHALQKERKVINDLITVLEGGHLPYKEVGV